MGPYHRIEDIPSHRIEVGEVKVLSGEQGMVFFGTLAAGTEVPRHSHPTSRSPSCIRAGCATGSATARRPRSAPARRW